MNGAPSADEGIQVSSAGDVNGDGFTDFIVGSPVDTSGGNVGGAYVVFGGPSGLPTNFDLNTLDGSDGFRIVGGHAGDQAGYSVSSAGDINGDGFADVMIGVPQSDADGTNAGAAYIVFGKASGFSASLDLSSINGTNGFRVSGATPGDFAGVTVASAGDVNGDGIPDLLIGAPFSGYHVNQGGFLGFAPLGAAYVVFGSASGFGADLNLSHLNGSNGFKIADSFSLTNFQENLGTTLAWAGDVNGDGYDDIIVGLGRGDQQYVIFGSVAGFPASFDPASLNGSNGFTLDNASRFVKSAGDINGDGYADLVITNFSNSSPSVAYVVFGKASGFSPHLDVTALDGTNGFKIVEGAPQNDGATAAASAGDINGDGFDDLVIDNGRYVIFGKATGWVPTYVATDLDGNNGFAVGYYPGASTPVNFGGPSLASADINGDGLSDLILSGQSKGGTGGAFVLFGQQPDVAVSRTGTNISQHLVGGAFDDTLRGLRGDDHLYGNGGNDLLDGGAGNDVLDGGAGTDTATYAAATAGVRVNLTISGIQHTIGAGNDTLISIENLTGSPFADTLTGDGGANVILAGAGDDQLNGAAGDDTLDGGSGDDVLSGGGGFDTASYADATAKVTVSLAIAGAQDTIGAGVDTLIGIENLIGSPFGDTLTGNALNNVLTGGGGADVLDGGAGNDTLDGGPGKDTASYVSATAGVIASLAISGAQHTVGSGADTLISIENLTGSTFDDVLTGDGGDNVLNGGGGDDVLEGGAGDDKLIGSGGADVASYSHASVGVNVSLAITVAQDTGAAGTDTLIGIAGLTGSAFDDTLTGNALTNVLTGGAGNDTLDGGAGNDTLIGGQGQDQLTGGAGNDTFIFTALFDSRRATPDLITDFALHHDKIDLSAIDADASTSGDQAFHLGATSGHTGDVVVGYSAVHDRTVIDLYVNSDSTPDAEIWLTGNLHSITSADFVL